MTTPTANRSRWPLLAAGGCALLLACVVVAGAGAALLYLRRPAAAATPNVEYVLDASPRMLDETDGGTRLSVAQGVLAEIIRPASARVAAGLRVFGNGAVGASTCQDTALLVPLAPANQAAISDQVSSLQGGQGVDAALGSATVAAIRDLAGTRGKHALVVVTGGSDSCNPQAAQLVAQEAARQGIDLQLFVIGFQVSDADGVALKGLVDTTPSATYLKAANAVELRQTLSAIQTFVDQPNGLSVAQVVATAGAPAGTPVAAGTAPAGPTPTASNTGVIQLTVLAFAGQPAEGGGRLVVRAYSPPDHQNVLGVDYANPSALRLPAGQYDLALSYQAAAFGPFAGGEVVQWVNGVSVSSGLTTTQTYDMRLGQVNLTVQQAAGQPPPPDNYLFAFRAFHPDDLNNAAAWVIVTDTVTLQLAPGPYVLQVAYPGAELGRQNLPPLTFEVRAGQSLDYVFNLKLGHLSVEVDDAAGRPIDPAQVNATATQPGNPNQYLASSFSANPADLPLVAGQHYDVLLRLADGRQLTLTDQQVAEGETRTVKVSQSDFK